MDIRKEGDVLSELRDQKDAFPCILALGAVIGTAALQPACISQEQAAFGKSQGEQGKRSQQIIGAV